MKRIILPLIATGLLLSGCVYPNQKISLWQMAPTLQYRGFSIKKPTDKRWYMYAGEQNSGVCQWSMDNLSPTHSAYAVIRLERLPSPITSPEELEAYAQVYGTAETQRMKSIGYKSNCGSYQGQPCVYFTRTTRDLAPLYHDKPLVMRDKGFIVLHPAWPDIVLMAYFSQRGKSDELSLELDEVGKVLLNGVLLEPKAGERF